MKKIRIGNDIVIKWRVTINGEEVNLEGLDLSLYISTTYQPRRAIAFTVAGNEITATFKGVEQKVTGVYRLTLYRNEGENAQSILDACDAFELVSCSCLTVDAAFGGAEVELPIADLGVGIPGLSAYEIAVAEGYEGTQEEWLASLSAASEAAAAECREVIAEFSQAEDGRVTAEAQRVVNENSRIAGEENRAEAETDRAAAEQLRAAAESKRNNAELARIANENNRANAEDARSSAEGIRVLNENTRVADESTRSQNEAARVTAEAKRANAEAQRDTAEADRRAAEQVRVANETARQTAEQDRMGAEDARIRAEGARKTAEDDRIANEATRQTNEQARVAAETSRESAETDRADAEAARAEAEAARAEGFAGFTATLAAKEDVANKVTTLDADADNGHYPSAKAVLTAIQNINSENIVDGAVTLPKLSTELQSVINNVAKNASFAGIATPATNPGAPDGPVFYLATEAGTYSNFGGIELGGGLNILKWNNSAWVLENVIDNLDKTYSGAFYAKMNSLNLFDISKVSYSGKGGYYIDRATGLVAFDANNAGYYISHPIDVDANKNNTITIGQITTTFSGLLGWRFMDYTGKIISKGAMGGNKKTLVIPPLAKFFQFSADSNKNKNVFVSYNENATYIPYSNTIENHLQEASSNLLSGVGVEKNMYIYDGGTIVADSSYKSFLFNPIPIKEATTYTIGTFGYETSITGGGAYVIYDDDFNVIEGGGFNKDNRTGDSYWEFTTPQGAKYLRFNRSNYDKKSDLFLYEGNWDSIVDAQLFVVNGSNISKFTLANKAENITDCKNLFDKSAKIFAAERIIGPSDGLIRASSGYGLFVSYLMPVSWSKKYITISNELNFHWSQGWRFLSENMSILSYGAFDIANFKTIQIPIGAAYFQFSTSRANRERIQVEYGKEITDYVPYSGIASTDYVDAIIADRVKTFGVHIPDTLMFTNNRAQTLYFNNFIDVPVWQNPNAQIYGSGVNSYNGKIAICNIKSNTTLTLKRYEALENKTLKSIQAKCINPSVNSGKNTRIMCLGDSHTEIGYWVQSLRDNLVSDGVNVNLIGAMHSVQEGINLNISTENQTGGGLYDTFMRKLTAKTYIVSVNNIINKDMPINWGKYCVYSCNGYNWTVWGYDLDELGNGKMRMTSTENAVLPESGTFTRVSGDCDTSIDFTIISEVNKNPFWNTETDKFDAAGVNRYFEVWGFEKPNILAIKMGSNDLGIWATDTNINGFISQLKTFINVFREAVDAAMPVVFSIPPCAAINTGQNYDSNGRKASIVNFADKLYSNFAADENTYICPSFAFVDCEHGFGDSQVVVSYRLPEYKVSSSEDSVHPIKPGMYQMGDAVTPYIHYILSIL